MKVESGSEGENGKAMSIKAMTFGENDFSPFDTIKEFATSIRVGCGKQKSEKDPLDDQDQLSLDACDKMIAYVAKMTAFMKVFLSITAYRIHEEKLWRENYSGKYECIECLMNIKGATIRRYISCGRVAAVLLAAGYGFSVIPKSLDALIPFSSLKIEKDILKAFEDALADSGDGAITKDAAQVAISKLLGKPAKKIDVTKASSSSKTGTKNTAAQKTISAKETATELGKQMQQLGKGGDVKLTMIKPLAHGLKSLVAAYSKRSRTLKYLKKLAKLTGDIHALSVKALERKTSRFLPDDGE